MKNVLKAFFSKNSIIFNLLFYYSCIFQQLLKIFLKDTKKLIKNRNK